MASDARVPKVVPMKVPENKLKQSRFEVMPQLSARYIITGRSGSGKTQLIASCLQNFYRGCFKKAYLFVRTGTIDNTWIALTDWCRENMDYEENEQFMFTEIDPANLERLMDECADRLKAERRAKKKILSQTAFIFDDLTDDPLLKRRNLNPIDALFFRGRHINASVFMSIHSIIAASTIQRKNCSVMSGHLYCSSGSLSSSNSNLSS